MMHEETKEILTETDIASGLSKEEAAKRLKEGYGNVSKTKIGRSYAKIIFDNIFTVFNIVLYGIAILFTIFSSILNGRGEVELATNYFALSRYFFLIQPTINIIIGTFQEIRSKHALEKLKITVQSRLFVLRDGEQIKIPANKIVLGDIVFLEPGQNIPADMKLIEGQLEVDESLLTGESDTVQKRSDNGNDNLYSGSIVMAGKAKALVIKVGNDTYANILTKKVRDIKKKKSVLLRSLYRVINTMTAILFIIVGIIIITMIYKINRWGGDPNVFNPTITLGSLESFCQITVSASTFSIGVIPTGLVLLTSMALAVSAMKMAAQKTLVQELYSLENLSQVDTICLDKTGTLTDGTMQLEETLVFEISADINLLMRSLLKGEESQNATSVALAQKYLNEGETLPFKEIIPFSSERKYSGLVLEKGKELLLGAPEYLTSDKKVLAQCQAKAALGYRTLLLTLKKKPIAAFILKDNIRTSAKETIDFFNKHNVDVKIISGDALETVQAIASVCGVINPNKAIALQGKSEEEVYALAEEYTVFARVSPEQKEILVRALQDKKHKVAMTGDGVNDILALRKADSSITFEKATDSAKNCADVILLDNDFSHLKSLVSEGRRVVNNIERTSILFLMKAICVVLLAIALIPFKRGHMLFTIENLYLCQDGILAVAGFLLSLETSKEPIKGSYEENVFPKAIAGGVFMFIGALLPCLLNLTNAIKIENVSTLISLLTTIAGLAVLFRLSFPFSKYRIFVYITTVIVICLFSLSLPRTFLGGVPVALSDFFNGQVQIEFFKPWNSQTFIDLYEDWRNSIVILVFVFAGAPLYVFTSTLLEKFFSFFVKRWNRIQSENLD